MKSNRSRIAISMVASFMPKEINLQSSLIDFYLRNLHWRDRTWKNLALADLLLINTVLIVIKHIVIVYADLDRQTRLLLFDLATLLGGLPKFNTIFLLCMYMLSIHLNVKFHLKNQKNFEEGLIIMKIHLANGNRRNQMRNRLNHISYARETSLRRLATILYKILDISIAFVSKWLIIFLMIEHKHHWKVLLHFNTRLSKYWSLSNNNLANLYKKSNTKQKRLI